MFDLSKELKNWRTKFAQESGLQRKQLDEIEAHLLDSFAELSKAQSEEDAFREALKRLGQPEDIAAEYKKVHDLIPLDYGLFWFGIGILVLSAIYMLNGLYTAWEVQEYGKAFRSIGPLAGFSVFVLEGLGTYCIVRPHLLGKDGLIFACASRQFAMWLLRLLVVLWGIMLLVTLIKIGFNWPNRIDAFTATLVGFVATVCALCAISRLTLSTKQIGLVCLLFCTIPYFLQIILIPSATILLTVYFFIPVVLVLLSVMILKSVAVEDMESEDA